MKRLLLLASLLLLGGTASADINITEGSGKVVPSDTVSGKEYQKIKIVDGVAGGLSGAPVDPVGGMYVRLTTGTALAGQFQVVNSTLQVQQNGTLSAQVVTSTLQVQVNGTVPVSGTFFQATQPTSGVGSYTVTAGSGPFTMGFVSVTGSTIPASYQGTVSSVPVAIQGTASVQVVTSTLQVQQAGTLNAQVVTSTLQVQQNGTASVQVVTSTLQVQINGTVPVSGSFSGGPLSILSVVGSSPTVGYQGTISSVPVAVQGIPTFQILNSTLQVQLLGGASGGTSSNFSSAPPAQGTAAGFVGSNGNMQMGRVNVSSMIFVTAAIDGSSNTFVVGSSTLQVQINQGPAFKVDFTTGVQVNTGTKFLSVDFSTGVQVNNGSKFLNVDFSTGVQVNNGSKFLNVDYSTGVQVLTGTKFLNVDYSTGVQVNTGSKFLSVDFSTGVQVLSGTKFLQVDFSTGVQVNGQAASGAAVAGNPIETGLRVTSTTIPTAASDGQNIYQASDNIGRAMVTGMPWGLVLSTYSTVMSSNGIVGGATQGGQVLVSSSGAATRTYLCGCTFTNTTATTNEAVFTSPPGANGTQTKTHFLGIPASFVPSGYRHDCVNPFFASAINSSIGLYQSQTAGATAAIHYACTYFTGP